MIRTAIAWLLLTASALAQSSIDLPPSIEPYRVFAATVRADIPDGATFDGGWTTPEAISYLDHDERTIHATGKPGTHTLKFAGYWVHTEEIQVKDIDGNPRTIKSFLGSGQVDAEATITITGAPEPDPKPEPEPDPKPAPNQKYDLVFFHRAEELDSLYKKSRAQHYLLASLDARRLLEKEGHRVLRIMDDDQLRSSSYRDFIETVIGDEFPRVAIRPRGGGQVKDYPLPRDYKSLLKLLENPQ